MCATCSTEPVVGRMRPAQMSSRVDFPEPLAPTTAAIWPARKHKSTLRRAGLRP